MQAARMLEPEWLDVLPHEDPRAVRSRRDLVRVNALMGNTRIVARELSRVNGLRSVAEIGAGDGSFMRAVLRRLGPREIDVHLIDRQPLGTVTADVFDWLSDPAGPHVDAIVANLFLHHFDAARVERMMTLIARRTRAFVACEPRRSATALAGARLLGVVGCNDVTRHDAVVSVRAGFAGRELTALWPSHVIPAEPAPAVVKPGAGIQCGSEWKCEERAAGLFSHVFVARANG